MTDYLPSDIEEDKIKPVRGSLLAWLIEKCRMNHWTVGWGLRATKGADGGEISLDPNVLPEFYETRWRGKVTSSSGTAEEHTIEEVDKDGDVVALADGGRKTTNAKAHNGRKGVPTDTIVEVYESNYVDDNGAVQCYFLIPDGLTGTPKTLKGSGLTADTTDWDVETDGQPVDFDSGRVWFGTPIMAQFWRDVKTDASGFVTEVSGEDRFRLVADLDDSSYEGAIALVADGVDGAYIKHNTFQDEVYTLELTSGDASVTFDGGSSVEISFDEGGHYRNTPTSIDIRSTGGSADGQGYEQIELNDALVQANADGGIINFDDVTNSGTTLGVEWSVAVDGGNAEQVNVSATVDASGLDVTDFDGGATSLSKLIRITDAASLGVSTIDDSDYSGRVFYFAHRATVSNSQATWEEDSGNAGPFESHKVGAGETTDYVLENNSNYQIFIDVSDSHKLKIDVKAAPASTFFHWIQLLLLLGDRKTASDIDLDINS